MLTIWKPIILIALPIALTVFFLHRKRPIMWLALAGLISVQILSMLPMAVITYAAVVTTQPQPDLTYKYGNLGFGPIYENATITQGIHGQEYGHYAIDLSAGEGAEIHSPINGEVTTRYVDGYNNTVLVIENDRYEVTFLHGNYIVEAGDTPIQGQIIGHEANNGYTRNSLGQLCLGRPGCGHHTHISVFDKQLGRNVDPRDLGLIGSKVSAKSGAYQHRIGGVVSGYLSGYDKLPTDGTIQNRQQWGHIPENIKRFDALVAVLDCNRIGQTGTLFTQAGELYVLVFDCAGIEDGGANWMIENNYVAELDYYTRAKYPDLVGTEAILVFHE